MRRLGLGILGFLGGVAVHEAVLAYVGHHVTRFPSVPDVVIDRWRDLAVMAACPGLRTHVHQARACGLTTLLDYSRLAILHGAARHCRNIGGGVNELGDYRGESSAF